MGMNKYMLKLWRLFDGDNSLRIDYNLNTNSIVFDVGGYKGEWSEKLIPKYNCFIFIFEPVKEYYDIIINKFRNNKKIKVYNFGLSNEDKHIEICKDENKSSTNIMNTSNKEVIELVDISNFIIKNNINKIDLLKINIEGDEYNVIDSLFKNNIIKNILNIQVQFHNFVNDYLLKVNKAKNELIKTHFMTYGFDCVWKIGDYKIKWKKMNYLK
jgi:FkbM family methyltransferase